MAHLFQWKVSGLLHINQWPEWESLAWVQDHQNFGWRRREAVWRLFLDRYNVECIGLTFYCFEWLDQPSSISGLAVNAVKRPFTPHELSDRLIIIIHSIDSVVAARDKCHALRFKVPPVVARIALGVRDRSREIDVEPFWYLQRGECMVGHTAFQPGLFIRKNHGW